MTHEQIIHVQTRIGTTPDGFWGPKSEAKCRAHLRSMMPTPHPFPVARNVTAFYGRHGEPNGSYAPPTAEIVLPFTLFYEGAPVKTLHPHKKCAESLLRVFNRLAKAFPDDASRRASGILVYDGLYNPRPMRGGTAWSMHSWAIAIDQNANTNGNFQHWPTVATMPIEVFECYAAEGWTSAGAFWSRDAMHHQATQPD